jgi:hypothetical protein
VKGDGVAGPIARKQAALFRQESHAAARRAIGRVAEQQDFAGLGFDQSQNATERRALARAVHADEAGDAAGGHGKRDGMQARAAGEALAQVADLKGIWASVARHDLLAHVTVNSALRPVAKRGLSIGPRAPEPWPADCTNKR